MKFKTKAILAAVILASATNAFAGSTAELRVIGTVIPGSCKPEFAGGGAVDYGKISAGDLSATAVSPLQPRQITYTITCDAPIAIATSWVDNRSSTVSTWTDSRFGLGSQGLNNIGYYGVTLIPAQTMADGNAVDTIFADGGSDTWLNVTSVAGQNAVKPGATLNRLYSYATSGTVTPEAFRVYSGALSVRAFIERTSTLDMTAPLVLDGLSTMEVRYL